MIKCWFHDDMTKIFKDFGEIFDIRRLTFSLCKRKKKEIAAIFVYLYPATKNQNHEVYEEWLKNHSL